jgi:Coenzyme PQQ synthesis protein D (PqqD)
MESERLAKVGEVAETPDGKKALVNGEGKAYLVQESTVVIWDSFNEKTVGEVAQELAVASGRSPDEFRQPIQELAKELQNVGLLAAV